jgi:hypothetical protein
MSHGWVRDLQVWDIKKSVYVVVLFCIIAQLTIVTVHGLVMRMDA